jgi:hypothetical protein
MTRADKLLAIYIPICTALGVYVFTHIACLFTRYLPFTALICLLVAFTGAIFCCLNIRKYEVADIGGEPSQFLKSAFIDKDFSPEFKYINICVSICRNIQKRMNMNDVEISKRTINNQFSLWILVVIPLCPILSYLLGALYRIFCS